MHFLIFLKVAYKEKCDAANKLFRFEVKQFAYIKIVKDYAPKAEIVIELPENKREQAYQDLVTLPSVEIIDTVLPVGFTHEKT